MLGSRPLFFRSLRLTTVQDLSVNPTSPDLPSHSTNDKQTVLPEEADSLSTPCTWLEWSPCRAENGTRHRSRHQGTNCDRTEKEACSFCPDYEEYQIVIEINTRLADSLRKSLANWTQDSSTQGKSNLLNNIVPF